MFTVEELARLIGKAERSLWGKTVHGLEERRKLIAEYIINHSQITMPAKELTDKEIRELIQTMQSAKIAVLQENESVILHGKWIDRGYEVECPFCGFTCNDTHYLGKAIACPNCAATMDV